MDMKKTILRAKLSVMALVAVAGLVSCELDSNIVQEGDNTIKLAPTVNTYTKYNGSEFVLGDKISLLGTKYEASLPTTIKPTGNFIDNTMFTRGSLYFTGVNQIDYPFDNSKIDLFAIYPYKADFGLDMAVVPVSVAKDQTTSEAVLAQDLLVSTLSGQSPSAAPLPLVFDHVMAKLVVTTNVTMSVGTGDIKVKNVIFKLADKTTLDMTATDAGVNKPTIAVVETSDLTNTVEFEPQLVTKSWNAIVVPQTVAADVQFIEIVMTDGSSVTYSPNMTESQTSPFTLKSGTVNNIEITVNYSGATPIVVGAVTIVDWKTGAVISDQKVEGTERANFVGTSTFTNITKAIVTCKHLATDTKQTTYTLPVYYTEVGEAKTMNFDFKGFANAPKTDVAVITQVRFDNGTAVVKVFTGSKDITLDGQTPPEIKFNFDGAKLTWN